MGRVAALGCALCRRRGIPGTPAQVHHIRYGAGAGRKSPDWLTIPLCEQCHTGPHGIHGDRRLFKVAGVDELDLLADTIALLNRVDE